MYQNLMEQFRYGNMEDPDVYLDYTSRRTTNVIRLRNKFARLARKLIDEGQKEKAIETLDKGMELTPHSQLPYGVWVVEIINEYYRADATDKANNLAEELATYTKNELTYFSGLKQPIADAVTRDQRMAMHILHQLSQVTKKFGQDELSKDYQDFLNNQVSDMRGTGALRR
jgi:hypothetical protein